MAAAILDFGFIEISRPRDHPILTKFGVPTQILTPPSKIYPKFEFFKIQDGGRTSSLKSPMYLQVSDTTQMH